MLFLRLKQSSRHIDVTVQRTAVFCRAVNVTYWLLLESFITIHIAKSSKIVYITKL